MLKKIAEFLDDLWIMAGTMIGLYLLFSGFIGLIFDVLIDKIFNEIVFQIAYILTGLIIIFIVNGPLRKTFIDKIKGFFKKN